MPEFKSSVVEFLTFDGEVLDITGDVVRIGLLNQLIFVWGCSLQVGYAVADSNNAVYIYKNSIGCCQGGIADDCPLFGILLAVLQEQFLLHHFLTFGATGKHSR